LYDLLGLVHSARRDAASAEAAFAKATQIDPRLPEPHVRLAELYAVDGKSDAALTHALEALKLDRNNTRAMMIVGTVYQQRGDASKARDAYQNLLKLSPRDAGAANNLAVLLSEQENDLDGALKYATLAQQIAPGDPHVADTLGWILYRRRSFDEAAKLLRGSAQRLPDSPSVNYHFGMVSQQLGDKVAARQALTKAVSSPANFTGKDEARKALAELK
jgi:Flp pilus assembly protein TadD